MKPQGTHDCENAGRLADVSGPLETGKAAPSGSRRASFRGAGASPQLSSPTARPWGPRRGGSLLTQAGARCPSPTAVWGDHFSAGSQTGHVTVGVGTDPGSSATLLRGDRAALNWTSSAVTGRSGVRC